MFADTSALQLGLAALLVAALYVGVVVAFLKVPHLAVAATVVVFVLIPSAKVFAGDWVGASKDLIVLGAVSAAVVLCVTQRRLPDRSILALTGLLLLLYLVDIDGGHGSAWAHGVRIVAEPLALLLAGLVLPQPRRTFRWAVGAIVVSACLVAVYGLLQQVVGRYTVVQWGYSFGRQVRTADDRLRSFGTFDDPFAYASFLLYGIAVVLFWRLRGKLAWAVGGLLLAGLAASYVRTAVLVLGAYIVLLVVRGGRLSIRALAIAVTVLVAALVVVAVVLGATSRTTTIKRNVRTSHGLRTEVVRFRGVVLNGRLSAWRAALGSDPRQWALGRGVGKIGTAAERSAATFSPSGPETVDPAIRQADCMRGRLKSCPVDSGYLATVADVGVVGLIVLMALFVRLLILSGRAAVRGHAAGWVALAFLAGLLLDALARASFTGFPTAFIGLLVVGIALASVPEEADAEGLAGRRDLTVAR